MVSYRIEIISVYDLIRRFEEKFFLQSEDLLAGAGQRMNGYPKSVLSQKDNHFHYYAGESQERRKSTLIDAIIAEMPVFPIVFDGTSRPWKVIAGEETVEAILDFYYGKIKRLSGNRYMITRRDRFSDMSFFLKRKFLSSKIPCYVINPPTSGMEVQEIKNFFKEFYG